MRFFHPIRPLLLGWLVSFAAWGLVAAILGADAMSRGADFWEVAVKNGLRHWTSWALITPLLFRFVSRCPIDRARWWLVWPAHALVFAGTMFFLQAWKGVVGWGFPVDSHPATKFSEKNFSSAPPGGMPPAFAGARPGGMPRFDLLHYISFELPIYFLIVASAHLLVYRRRLDERAASLNRARLDALRSQLQPHFLFNTLNTIAGLVYDRPEKADAMLVALSDLLRMSLETSAEVELPLHREIEYVERYMAIMTARFEHRVACEIDVDREAERALVPAFILQPLVENAVQHGLQPRPEGGRVTVRATRIGPRLRLAVLDDGVGFRSTPNASEGIGLGNARARLEQLYGPKASLATHDGPPTEVVIELPFRLSP